MSKDNRSGLGKFLLGAGIGVGLGILFAPKKGSETRKDLKKKIDELVEMVQSVDYDEVRDNIVKKAKEIETEIKELDGEKALKIAKEKAALIEKKANELVDMAVASAKPALEDMAESIRKKTIKSLKAITKKLEDAK